MLSRNTIQKKVKENCLRKAFLSYLKIDLDHFQKELLHLLKGTLSIFGAPFKNLSTQLFHLSK